jgi:virulence-associated protein VapD
MFINIVCILVFSFPFSRISFFFYRLFNQEYFLRSNILQVLIHYLKFNHIQNAVYIYDNNFQSKYRIYQLIELMNTEEYFNSFSLDIRIIQDEDIYSLLFSIEANSFQKNILSKYILLDFYSYDQYERIFQQISHMGLYSQSPFF